MQLDTIAEESFTEIKLLAEVRFFVKIKLFSKLID